MQQAHTLETAFVCAPTLPSPQTKEKVEETSLANGGGRSLRICKCLHWFYCAYVIFCILVFVVLPFFSLHF